MKNIITRSRAPLRISFGGGGTEIDPYRSKFGGEILNTTISLFAYTTIEAHDQEGIVTFIASDLQIEENYNIESLFQDKDPYKKATLKFILQLF